MQKQNLKNKNKNDPYGGSDYSKQILKPQNPKTGLSLVFCSDVVKYVISELFASIKDLTPLRDMSVCGFYES